MQNYTNKLKIFARKNRKSPTQAEAKLWYRINQDKFRVRFRRQHTINSYIVDFCCTSLKLVIEIDGASHDEKKYDYDLKRQKEIEGLGYFFLRFSEFEVMNEIDRVILAIEFRVEELKKRVDL
jgi:very-short-patch-repair endonuclease